MLKYILTLGSFYCFAWFVLMTINFHKLLQIKRTHDVELKENMLLSLYSERVFTRGKHSSEPIPFQLAKLNDQKNKIDLADSFYRTSIKLYPNDFRILRDYSKFLLRKKKDVQKALELSLKAVGIMAHDYDLNLLASECSLISGNYDDAYSFTTKVYHNDYIHRSYVLLNELFYRLYLLDEEDSSTNRDSVLMFRLDVLEQGKKHELYNLTVKQSNNEVDSLETDLVQKLDKSEFIDYTQRRYSTFINFYYSIWFGNAKLSSEQSSIMEHLLSNLHANIKFHKRRYDSGYLDIDDLSVVMDSIRKVFNSDFENLLESYQIKEYNFEDIFKRLSDT